MEETSLDDFVGDADSPTDASSIDAEGGGDGGGADEDPTVTAAWSPGGGTCEACGESAEWRWREGGRLVCPGCKDW